MVRDLNATDGAGSSISSGSATLKIVEHDLSAGSKAQLDPENAVFNGLVTVMSDGGGASGNMAEFEIKGSGNAVNKAQDPNGDYTDSEGTGGTTNIYWDSTNSRYEIENAESGAREYVLEIMIP